MPDHVTVAEVEAWARSPEGQEALRKALADADRVIRELQKARKVDWSKLREPVGPIRMTPDA